MKPWQLAAVVVAGCLCWWGLIEGYLVLVHALSR